MNLMGNGNSDVKNHFSKDRRSNLHLVSAESQGDVVGAPRDEAEIAKASASVPNPQLAHPRQRLQPA
jgi:hypothetical protein